MKVLVTGASGYLGNKLAMELARSGNKVHALIRSDASTKYLQHANIRIFYGDILDKKKVLDAIENCSQVYHTAACVSVWESDPSVYYAVNVQGTRNVLDAALNAGVEKFVFTSTCGAIGYSLSDPIGEDEAQSYNEFSDYDESKRQAEEMVFAYRVRGLEVVIVSPTKIYGPGHTSHALTTNTVIKKFIEKGITFVPAPGSFKICLAFIDDVVNGHIMAMEKGKSGGKYILGGINCSYLEFFSQIRELAFCKGKIIPLSKNVLKVIGHLLKLNYKITGRHPAFAAKRVSYVFHDYIFCSDKAINQLGYRITPLHEALTETIGYLKKQKKDNVVLQYNRMYKPHMGKLVDIETTAHL
ncbi:MAG: NAD-dependent epimerase/dehydratase family protein [Ferruginibacter sp.]